MLGGRKLPKRYMWAIHVTDENKKYAYFQQSCMAVGAFFSIRLYKNLANKPEAHVRILPSHAILNNSQWDIEIGRAHV